MTAVQLLNTKIEGGVHRPLRGGDSGVSLTVPMRIFVPHTTEGTSLPGYSGGSSAPHATVDLASLRFYEHFGANQGARALIPGPAKANNYGAYQVEFIMYAKDAGNLSGARFDYMAYVMDTITTELGIPQQATADFSNPRWGLHAPQRLSTDEYLAYAGFAGHCHVPGNDHWDPGKLDMEALLTAMDGTYDPGAPPAKPVAKASTGSEELLEDGEWGKYTTTELQDQLDGLTLDGEIWRQLTADRKLHDGMTTGWKYISRSSTGSPTILKVQKKLKRLGLYHGRLDGELGYWTILALQTLLKRWGLYKRNLDGDCGFFTVVALQQALNAGKFN